VKLLALDTSLDACSVALYLEGDIEREYSVEPRSHTRLILPMVDTLLKKGGCDLRQLDAIAYGRGPGSFTGLRICAGIVQGLAYGANLGVIPVSTLEMLAMGWVRRNRDTANKKSIITAIDARMDEVYWCAYRWRDGRLLALAGEQVSSPGAVSLAGCDNPVGVGNAWQSCPGMPDVQVDSIDTFALPDATDIIPLALCRCEKGELLEPEKALPVYVRNEVSWKKRDQQPGY
jgi:tRNA threonylcarbamoyladenosine biosynthesis protein TsaB